MRQRIGHMNTVSHLLLVVLAIPVSRIALATIILLALGSLELLASEPHEDSDARDGLVLQLQSPLPDSDIDGANYRVRAGMTVQIHGELIVWGIHWALREIDDVLFETNEVDLAAVSGTGKIIFFSPGERTDRLVEVVVVVDEYRERLTFEVLPDIDTSLAVDLKVGDGDGAELRRVEGVLLVLCVMPGEEAQLTTHVQFADGVIRDTTADPWTEFFSTAPWVVSVSVTGLVHVIGSNDERLPIVPIRITYKDLEAWVMVDYSKDCHVTELYGSSD